MDKNYIAGFFDGEGSVYEVNNKIFVSIPQTNYDVLEKIVEFCGYGLLYETKKQKKHHKQAWVIRIQKKVDVLDFLLMIKDIVIVKKEIVNHFINVLTENKIKLDKKQEQRIVDMKKVMSHVNAGLSYRTIGELMNFSRQKVLTLTKEYTILGD